MAYQIKDNLDIPKQSLMKAFQQVTFSWMVSAGHKTSSDKCQVLCHQIWWGQGLGTLENLCIPEPDHYLATSKF